MHVVVIDDEPALRDILCELLTDEGYRTSVRGTLFDDLDELSRLSPDLIILDIILGGQQTGLAFLERLKDDPRTRTIPVIICTGASHLTDDIQARLTAWDCRVMPKPFDLDALLEEIHRCLRQHESPPALV